MAQLEKRDPHLLQMFYLRFLSPARLPIPGKTLVRGILSWLQDAEIETIFSPAPLLAGQIEKKRFASSRCTRAR